MKVKDTAATKEGLKPKSAANFRPTTSHDVSCVHAPPRIPIFVPSLLFMRELHCYLIKTYLWIQGSTTDHAIHFTNCRIDSPEPLIEQHHKINKIPLEMLSCVRRVLPTEDRERTICSLSVMVRSENCVTGPHIDRDWVSAMTDPFDILNLSDISYTVQLSKEQPTAAAFTITVPQWAGYRLEGQFRSDWKHAVGGYPRRVLMRIGFLDRVSASRA